MMVMMIIRTFVMVMMMMVKMRTRTRITWRFQMEWVLVRTYRRPCCPGMISPSNQGHLNEGQNFYEILDEREKVQINSFSLFLQFLFLNINALNTESYISYPLPDIRALISAPVNHIIKRVDI